MLCSICNKPIVLVPSATERSNKYGNTPAFYTSLFTTHSKCFLDKRAKDTKILMQRRNYA